jgi:hypothetical protein
MNYTPPSDFLMVHLRCAIITQNTVRSVKKRSVALMRRRYLLIIGMITAVALCSGCGPYTPHGSNALPLTKAKPSPIQIKPRPTATRGVAHTVPNGSVKLLIDAPVHLPGDTISLTVINSSDQSIFFPDHLTNCTVILLQELGPSPQTVNLCKLMTPTGFYSLDVGQNLAVRLVAPPHGWMPGLYVAALSYGTSLSSLQTTISSEEFQVT